MITCKYTKTKRIKEKEIEVTRSLEVCDTSDYRITVDKLLKELWDKFERKDSEAIAETEAAEE